jgi:hypothetical protein
MNNLSIISLSLLLDGMFVAGIFSFASLYKVENQQNVVSQLYAADLIGGSLGSLFASLMLIPLYGFFVTLLLIAVLTLFCFILVF